MQEPIKDTTTYPCKLRTHVYGSMVHATHPPSSTPVGEQTGIRSDFEGFSFRKTVQRKAHFLLELHLVLSKITTHVLVPAS